MEGPGTGSQSSWSGPTPRNRLTCTVSEFAKSRPTPKGRLAIVLPRECPWEVLASRLTLDWRLVGPKSQLMFTGCSSLLPEELNFSNISVIWLFHRKNVYFAQKQKRQERENSNFVLIQNTRHIKEVRRTKPTKICSLAIKLDECKYVCTTSACGILSKQFLVILSFIWKSNIL